VTFPRSDIEKISGIPIPANKRNGREQAQHVKIMNAVRDVLHPDGSWRNVDGRPSARRRVWEYRQQYPDAPKAECVRSTGLSKKTVYKWWDGDISFPTNDLRTMLDDSAIYTQHTHLTITCKAHMIIIMEFSSLNCYSVGCVAEGIRLRL
jgi:hypothetical protein